MLPPITRLSTDLFTELWCCILASRDIHVCYIQFRSPVTKSRLNYFMYSCKLMHKLQLSAALQMQSLCICTHLVLLMDPAMTLTNCHIYSASGT